MTKLKKTLLLLAGLAALALGGAALAGASSGNDNLSGSTSTRAEKAALAETGGGKVTDSERDNEHGATYEVEVTKDGGDQVDVRLDDQFKVVAAEPDHEDADDATDEHLSGATLDRASKAALAKTGGGKVTGSERDTEDGATYEIEVTKGDGSQVDVRLDDQFKVVAVDADHED
jgi:uncharacterized membrane protein YkoI